MREIKFRAFHKGAKEMLFGTNENTFRWQAEGQPIELMQFTGLKDKNGKEIYEGDICRTHDWLTQPDGSTILSDKYKVYSNVVIEYIEKLPFPGYVIHKWYEVIGNIYENAELLNPKP